MDESGTSKGQPYLTVAGVIVHADLQLEAIESHLETILEGYVAEENRDGFVFHAADIFSNNREELPPELWDDNTKQLRLLDDLVAIPGKLKLPICVGFVRKETFQKHYAELGLRSHKVLVGMHAAAIALCASAAELWMRNNTTNEVAWIFAENNTEVRGAAKETHILMKSHRAAEVLRLVNNNILPLIKIKDGINFANKMESPTLQLADACVWAIRKWLERKDDKSNRFYGPLEPHVVSFSMTTLDAAGRL
jgi:Protein of unknown function (DUF3800)